MLLNQEENEIYIARRVTTRSQYRGDFRSVLHAVQQQMHEHLRGG